MRWQTQKGMYMKKIVEKVMECKQRYEAMAAKTAASKVSREQFTLLLGGISACRKVPGIPVHMGYESLYFCDGEEEKKQVRQHLQRMYGVEDKDSLMQACWLFSGSREYEQFMTFWKDAPLFDINELNPEGRSRFEHCRKLAEAFCPFVEEKGFYAWDINERIGLCRNAAACGIISEEEFWQITDEWVRQAQVFYHSYGEYALSCLCGALYEMGRDEPDVEGFLEINDRILESLLAEGGVWQRNGWYIPKEREWASLLDANPGCFITKKALDAQFIGYMYHDEPHPDYPDSGWRFFVGDESEEYINDPDNTTVCGLNTICNLFPDVMAYLCAGEGRRFGRQEHGWEEE